MVQFCGTWPDNFKSIVCCKFSRSEEFLRQNFAFHTVLLVMAKMFYGFWSQNV